MKRWAWLLFPTLALAQSTESETIKTIETRFKDPERFTEARHINTAVYEYPYRPVALSAIKITPIVQRALKPKSPIQNIKTFKLSENPKRLIVNLHERADEHGFFYLVDKNGEVTRRVQMQFVEAIDDVTVMYEPPKTYVEVVRQKDVPADDKETGYLSQFSLRVGQTSANWTADLLNDTRATTTFSTTLGANLLLDWQESFRMGATLQYESSNHRLQSSSAQYRNPSFGLIIQSPPSYWGGGPWRVGAQVRTGPFANLQIQDSNGRPTNIKIRTTTFQLDWQYIGSNGWGEWSMGLAYQRDYPKLRRQETIVRLNSQASTNDQIGLFVTQGFAW